MSVRSRNGGKVKIKKWLGIADQKRYEDFVWRWHTFLKNCEEGMKELDEQNAKVTVVVLRNVKCLIRQRKKHSF